MAKPCLSCGLPMDANHDLIVAAPTLISAMADEIDELRARLDDAKPQSFGLMQTQDRQYVDGGPATWHGPAPTLGMYREAVAAIENAQALADALWLAMSDEDRAEANR